MREEQRRRQDGWEGEKVKKIELHTVKWTSSVRMFIRIWKIIMPSATLDLRTSWISWAQTLPFPGGRKELKLPGMLPPFWNWSNTPAHPFGISFENIWTAHRRIFPGLGRINGRRMIIATRQWGRAVPRPELLGNWPWHPTWAQGV